MKLQSIQVLRGLAALLVAFYHAQAMHLQSALAAGGSPGWTGGILANGYAGVDLFFVISGFVMVWVTRTGKGGLAGTADFLFARVTRIYPLWWAAALLATLYYLHVHTPGPAAPLWQTQLQAGEGGAYLLKSFLLVPQDAFPVLSIGWTLIHELYFYAVFAVFVLLRRAWLLLVWAAAVMVAAAMGHAAHEARSFATLAAHPLTIEFILGAFAALLLNSGRVIRPGLLASAAVVWLLAALCYVPEPDPEILKWGRVIAFGLPCVLLVYALAGLDQQRRLHLMIPAGAALLAGAVAAEFAGTGPASAEAARLAAASMAAASGAAAALVSLALLRLLRKSPAPDAEARPGWPLRALARTGDWSYSIYLGHLFVIGAVQTGFARLGQNDALAPVFRIGHAGWLDDAAFYSAILIGTLMAGWLGYRLVERPALALSGRIRRGLFGEPVRPAVATEPR